MPPGSIFYRITFQSTFICIFTFPIYIIKYQKYIYLIILSLSDLTFASGREGIDNPFIALVARFLFVCAGTRYLRVVSYWIDTLVLKTEGNTYATLLHHPFLFKGKPTHAQEVERGQMQCRHGDFWCGSDRWCYRTSTLMETSTHEG